MVSFVFHSLISIREEVGSSVICLNLVGNLCLPTALRVTLLINSQPGNHSYFNAFCSNGDQTRYPCLYTVMAKTYVITIACNKFPNCLCSISTRQLELLLWRAGPTAQHMQDSQIFFIQLNYVYNRKE